MLEADAEGLGELADDVQGGIGILDVIVRQFFAVQLTGRGQGIGHGDGTAEELGVLMRVLAIPQGLFLVEGQEELLRQAGLGTHIGRDGHIVFGRVGIGLGGKGQAGFAGGVAGRFNFLKHSGIVGRIHDHGHALPVLGGAAQHGRTADVDVLHGIFHGHIGFGDGLAEGIQVHTNQVDFLDAVFLQGLHVGGHVAAGQQGTVNLGMQGLHPTVANLRETGYIAHARHGKTRFAKQFHRAARGQDLPARGYQPTGEFYHAGLITNTD